MNAMVRSKAGSVAALLGAYVVGAVACTAGGSSDGGAPMVDPLGGAGGGVDMPPPSGGGTTTEPPSVPSDDGNFIVDPDDVPVGMETPGAPVLRHRNLIDKQVTCEGGATTTVSGTVYIPSGQLPLYNVMVYVPETELGPLPQGASCSCEISGEPITTALTDANGRFVLENVPVGGDIPVVIQVGDWRREVNIGTVEPCVDNPVVDHALELPSNRSEGDIPKIAVVTGIADALECLMRKLGIDDAEFSNPREEGRVNLFAGLNGTGEFVGAGSLGDGSGRFPPAEALWNDVASLQDYDVVLLSCDGDEGYVGNKPPVARQAMYDYANLGGRVFASHYHGVWFQEGPGDFPRIATFTSEADTEFRNITAQVVTDFPKGEAMAEWIVSTGVSLDGEVPIAGGRHTIVAENTDYAQRWLETEEPASVQYISANTPFGASDAEQCGRVVLSDLHVSPGPPDFDFSRPGTQFPEGCITDTLTPQEAVLAFMLFDLSACIVPDDQAPVAPPVTIR
jgi:hypothetical protein